MALFRDEPLTEVEKKQVGNEYLEDPAKGLKLVQAILKQQKQYRLDDKEAMYSKVLTLLTGLELDEEVEFQQRLFRIREQAKEQRKVSLLDGKVVLGVGGCFSAGKSCFINSITNARLPENQNPTTSISTYIIHANRKQNIVLTTGGDNVQLNDKAVQALTHQFYETYHIGFSRVIQNLVLCSPEFKYPNIAILDTPGYNKADIGKIEDATDAKNAQQQLNSVDYLIWLVDINNGVLKENDETFIKSLNVSKPILIVLNKADTMYQKEKMSEVVNKITRQLKESRMNVFGVIAYGSQTKETFIGEDTLERFLNMVNNDNQRSLSLERQLDDLQQDISRSITKRVAEIKGEQERIGKTIGNSTDSKGLKALIAAYVACNEQTTMLYAARYDIQEAFKGKE